jgi:predicted MFS family arabinose efflux permease
VPDTSSIVRRALGGEIDRALRPVLVVTLLHAISGSARVSFLGIWAIRELDASSLALGVTFTCAAIASVFTGYLGGHASDYIGRRPLILAASGGQAAVAILLVANGDAFLTGLALVVVGGAVEALGIASDQAILTDLVPPERREQAFAAARVVQNLGFVAGPPVGALLLLAGWSALFAGTAAIALIAFAAALRFLPRRGMYAPEAPPERASWTVLARDRRFALLFVAGCFASIVYLSYETLMPISATDTYGLSPSAWGAVLVINPLMVTFLQLRVTTWTSGAPDGPKLAIAMLAMGLPLLVLTETAALLLLVPAVIIFVVGEMLWVPAMQALVVRSAPDDLRGAYLGAIGASFPVAFALGPLIGLSIREAYGDAAMWVTVAALSIVAALAYVVAARAATPALRE